MSRRNPLFSLSQSTAMDMSFSKLLKIFFSSFPCTLRAFRLLSGNCRSMWTTWLCRHLLMLPATSNLSPTPLLYPPKNELVGCFVVVVAVRLLITLCALPGCCMSSIHPSTWSWFNRNKQTITNEIFEILFLLPFFCLNYCAFSPLPSPFFLVYFAIESKVALVMNYDCEWIGVIFFCFFSVLIFLLLWFKFWPALFQFLLGLSFAPGPSYCFVQKKDKQPELIIFNTHVYTPLHVITERNQFYINFEEKSQSSFWYKVKTSL